MEETRPESQSKDEGPDASAALKQVVDDLSPREECADWIAQQMVTGRTGEAIAAEMVENGWDAEDAEELVEQVRRVTRHERGAFTREEVVAAAQRRYRQSWSLSWFSGMPSFAMALRLLGSLRQLAALKRVHAPRPDDQPDIK